MTQQAVMAIITPLAFSLVFQAIPYIHKKKIQEVMVAFTLVAFIIIEVALILQITTETS